MILLVLVCMDIFSGDRSFSLYWLGLLSVLIVAILIGLFVAPLFLAEDISENEELAEIESAPLIVDNGTEFVFTEDTVVNFQVKFGASKKFVSETRYDSSSKRALVKSGHVDMYNYDSDNNSDIDGEDIVYTSYYEYNESSGKINEHTLYRIYNWSEQSFVSISEMKEAGLTGCQVNETAVIRYNENARADKFRVVGYNSLFTSSILKFSVTDSGNDRTVQIEDGLYAPTIEGGTLINYPDLVRIEDSSGGAVAENKTFDVKRDENENYGDDGDNDTHYVVEDANISATVTAYWSYEDYPVVNWWESQTEELFYIVDEEKTDVSIERPEYVDAYNSSCT